MLTSLGKKTAVASAALYGMAYTLGYPELVVPAVVGGLSLATAVVTVARRPRIGATVDVTPTRVGRGQQVRVTAVLRNDGRWRSPRFTLRLPFGHNSTETAIRPLARRETREIALTLRLE